MTNRYPAQVSASSIERPAVSFSDPGALVRTVLAGLLAMAIALPIYWLSGHLFDAGRPDFFYLADAFLHGRIWLLQPLGPYDVVVIGGRTYVPFAPFPAILFVPLMLIVSPTTAHAWEPLINSTLATVDVGLAWWLVSRIGVRGLVDRLWLVALLGFSTAIWWVTTRGGVWHTGHLIATGLTLAALIECFGRRRALLLGFLAGLAFMTRAPLALALLFYAYVVATRSPLRPEEAPNETHVSLPAGGVAGWIARVPWRGWVLLGLGFLPSLVFMLWYNDARFGSPFESGYGLASLPAWLDVKRDQGVFSLSHLGMNVDYFLLHLPASIIPTFPYFRPDGLGMSILLTSPGLLLAVRADWRRSVSWALAATTALVMIPNLLYYGGGWLQYGYRYALDAIPFAFALCALAAARHGVGWGWRALIAFGIVVNLGGVYWAYHL